MKLYLKLTLLLLFPLCGFAQNLSDAKTFKRAIELAQKQQKLILLIINPDFPPEIQAKVPANLALIDPDVAKKAKDNFIIFDTKRTDTSIKSIVATLKINRFPAFLFMHPSKDVFHIDYGYSTTKHKYLAMFNKAIELSNEKTATELQNQYQKDPTDYVNLKELINTRKRNGITDNAELIEQYVNGLKIGDFNDYQTVLFILDAGPYVDGSAYKLAYTNKKIVDSIFKTEPKQTTLNISNKILGNTMYSAVRIKSFARAMAGANFTRNSYGRDYNRGNKGYSSQLLYYYSSVKDTANYLRSAVQHYDQYYMNISADSIKKAEEKDRLNAMERMKSSMQNNTLSKEKMDSLMRANPNRSTRTETIITTSNANGYSTELNNIASRFYSTGTKNLNYLSKAMLWSKRAIELEPKWGYYDTLAHIYYAMGIHSEALTTQKIAIDLAKKESNNTEYVFRTTEAYEKMKKKTL